jgi:large subunit ribosomal protein L22
MSPRKIRLVARAIKGLVPNKAIDYLAMTEKKAAKPLIRLIQQAIGNAKNNFSLSPADLTIESVQINDGPRGPKRLDRSHSARFDRGIRRRRMSHLFIKLSSKEK